MLMNLDQIRSLAIPAQTKIVLIVSDGLGGLPHPEKGRTELEVADTPHLDRLAKEGLCGFTVPVAWGVTPGSGPGHLGLFGYDPLIYDIGRGILEAVGIDFPVAPQDVAARGNFCTVDAEGRISDRRAGRIPTQESALLVERLRAVRIPGVEIFIEPVRDYRFVLVLRGEGLSDQLTETDPQREGVPPLPVQALAPEAEETARIANEVIAQACRILGDRERANAVLVRGFSKYPDLPSFCDIYKMRAGAIAVYPMYRGLAKLVGMTALPSGQSIEDEVESLRRHWEEFDFFFVHYKDTDSAGEDGSFERKVKAIEVLDGIIPAVRDLNPDVLMIAGDHSTPSVLAAHSWHPVPFVLFSRWVRPDAAEEFNERECARGSLGNLPATAVMSLAMAYAQRFAKYGA